MAKNWSLAEIRALYLQLWPEGDLYDWFNTASFIFKHIDATAQFLKTYAYDLLEALKLEIFPPTATYKVADYEAALGLSNTRIAQTGTLDQRRAAVVAKLRESGAFTRPNVRAILGVLLGYADPSQLVIYGSDRTKMRLAHTYGDAVDNAVTVADGSPVVRDLWIVDSGVVSKGSAQPTIRITVPALETVSVTLLAPDGKTTYTWSKLGTGAATNLDVTLNGTAFVGVPCAGRWRITVSVGAGAASGTVKRIQLFVEGDLHRDLKDWGAYADPNLMGGSGVPADLAGAAAAIERIKFAFTTGHLLLTALAIPNKSTTLPGQCFPA